MTCFKVQTPHGAHNVRNVCTAHFCDVWVWLSAESGSSSRGANRQIVLIPGGWEERSPVRGGCAGRRP